LNYTGIYSCINAILYLGINIEQEILDEQMSGVEDKLEELIDTINRSMKYGQSPFTNPGTSGRPRKKRDDTATSTFSKTVTGLTTVMGGMHKGSDDFIWSLARATKGFVGLELAVGAFKKILEVGKSYSKMTDIGQNFNGSLLTMMSQVGKSGLSIEEFSSLMSRNSVVTGMLNDATDDYSTTLNGAATSATKNGLANAKSTKQTLGDLQLGVRNNLQQFGFYGMALDEVTSATSDYMETMRLGGQILKMDGAERKKAVGEMLHEVSSLSIVYSKSRQEIMKTTNDAMRQTEAAAGMIGRTPAAVEAINKAIANFAGQSDILAKSMAVQIGRGGYMDNDFSNALIDTGNGAGNQILQKTISDLDAGRVITDKESSQRDADLYNMLAADKARLQTQTHSGSPNAAAAKMMLDFVNQNQKFINKETGQLDQEKLAAAKAKARKDSEITDMVTNSALTFESSFKEITGGFIQGFYGAFAEIMGGSGNLQASLIGLRSLFIGMGTVLGGLIAVVVKIASAFGLLFSGIDWFVKKIKPWIGMGDKDDDGKDTTTGGITSLVATIAVLVMGWMATSRFRSFLMNGVISGASQLKRLPGAGRVASFGGKAAGMLSKIPGFGWLKKAEKLGEGVAAGIGGDGCCESLAGGLSSIRDRIDFHGERAHGHATGLKKAGLSGAADLAEAAPKSWLGRMGSHVATGANATKSWFGKMGAHVATGVGATKSWMGSLGSRVATGLGATKSWMGSLAAKGAGVMGSVASNIGPVAGKAAGGLGKIGSSLGKTVLGSIGGAAKGIAGAVGKGLLPGIALVSGAMRLMEGDYMGAGLDAIAGVASFIPVVGTAIAGIAEAANVVRDIAGHEETDKAVGNFFGFGPKADVPVPTNAYATDHGTVMADSEGSTGPATQAEADQQKMDTIKTQIDRLNDVKKQLDTKVQNDDSMGDTDSAQNDREKLQKAVDTLVFLQSQSNKLQKDSDLKMAAAVQDVQVFGNTLI
jgi:hypothetical protein